jgi:nucleotide-binding universal stress UspA family protein
MFNKILVPLDRSALAERVLPHVAALAAVFQSRVTLLHVLDPVHMTNYARAVDAFDWHMHRAEAEKYLAEMVTQMGQAGVVAESIIMEGDGAERVVEHARASRSDLLMLSSHGQSGLSGWSVSSVVQKIILRAHTSIMIVRAYQPAPSELIGLRYHRLLLPMDGSRRAECVLPPAEMLAHAHNAQALFVHVVRRPEMPRRTPLSPEDAGLAQQIVERNQAEAARYLDELKSRLSGNTETRLLAKDSVEAALHEMADQEQVDLVILSAHGYTGETRWPHGGVVTSFLTHGNTPLLIVQDVPQDNLEPGGAGLADWQLGRQ